ncbi:MAG: hypothetical protein QF744_13045 [SAR202 cluster bacterium]|nr:hypothetical protein [SAR202 cluster bacterium]
MARPARAIPVLKEYQGLTAPPAPKAKRAIRAIRAFRVQPETLGLSDRRDRQETKARRARLDLKAIPAPKVRLV